MTASRILAIFWFMLFAIQCSSPNIAGNGGSSETVNALVIVTDSTLLIDLKDGNDESLRVSIYSPDYNPYNDFGLADSFFGNDVPWTASGSGIYNLVATLKESGRTAFIAGCTLAAGVQDTISCSLNQPVCIEGIIKETETFAEADSYALSIIGSPFYAVTSQKGTFTFSALPEGLYQLSMRPVAGQFFLSPSIYSINTSSFGKKGKITLIIP